MYVNKNQGMCDSSKESEGEEAHGCGGVGMPLIEPFPLLGSPMTLQRLLSVHATTPLKVKCVQLSFMGA